MQEEVEVEALVLERKSIARDHALGLFISLLHQYLARQSDLDDVGAALVALQTDLAKELPVPPFNEFQLDTTEIYQYVEGQKGNAGLLADDPEWNKQTGVKASSQWDAEFRKALSLTRQAYVEACERFQHRFDLGSEADLALVKLLAQDELVRLVVQNGASPRHVPALPPKPSSHSSPASPFWTKRISSNHSAPATSLPQFDVAHLIEAGHRFRTACLELLQAKAADSSRTSRSDEDMNVILSQAFNHETNPERLIKHARQRFSARDSATADAASSADDEAAIKSAKDLLSSALRILSTRDGERNVSLRINALNLRAQLNLRIAALKPVHQLNYLNRALTDWTASYDLDQDQPEVSKELSGVKARLESLEKEGTKETAAFDGSKSSNTEAASAASAASVETKAPTTTTTAATSSAPLAEPKAREKTILESPFFRSDLVTGLMVDSLLALSFPHRALRETIRLPCAATVAGASQDHVPALDRFANTHQQTTKALTAENKAQLKEAIKNVSAVLALPELQLKKREDSVEKVLRTTSLRLVLGTLHLLLNDFVRAQTELDLVSNALKPNTNLKGGKGGANGQQKNNSNASNSAAALNESSQPATDNAAESSIPAPSPATLASIAAMQTRVQGETLFLLAKTCWMANKMQESVKFFRWFAKWYSEQQREAIFAAQDAAEGDVEGDYGERESADVEIAQLDPGWWDKLLAVPARK